MRLTTALALLAFCGVAAAQEEGFNINFDEVPTVHFPSGDRVVSAYPAFEDYMYMFFDVCDAMGFSVEKECLIYPMNADLGGNALATVVEGNRVIVYDRQLSPLIGYEGAQMLIAHELAHHHCDHIGTKIDPRQELQADAFAGASARLMGISLDVAVEVADIFSERPSPTHPAKQDRIDAITAGWNDPEAGKACSAR